MFVQSCDGLELSDMSDASVGTCAASTQFCMPAACEDVAVGIDCFCFLDGVTPTTEPLPAGCMDSGELAMAAPSSRELPLAVVKPGSITQEVRAARANRERRESPAAQVESARECPVSPPAHRADGARQHWL